MRTAKLRDKIEIAFREVPAVLLAFGIIFVSSVYVHKPIKTADSNNSLQLPHKDFQSYNLTGRAYQELHKTNPVDCYPSLQKR
jgi:hypothetical protein